VGIVLLMEGADPIVAPAQLQRWFDDGPRVVGLAHYGPSAYAVGTGDSGPLTASGAELLRAMRRLRMILDLTHGCDPSFYQAIDLFDGPLLASHNNCRALVPGDRQFSDEQIRLIIERCGVIGVALDAWMLHPGWIRGASDRGLVTLENTADHIDHICQLAGNAHHAAIGSDLDGGFGTEQCPADLDSIADLQKLAGILDARGYTSDDVARIFHGNWLRFFAEHLK
jgi:membrane dipeptidase